MAPPGEIYNNCNCYLALVGVVTNKPGNLQFSGMSLINFDYHPQFFTATISEWKPLFKRRLPQRYHHSKLKIPERGREYCNIFICNYAQSYTLDLADTGWL